MAETKEKTRRPKARHRDVVIAAMEERLTMFADPIHVPRMLELLDELKRSIGRDNGKESSDE